MFECNLVWEGLQRFMARLFGQFIISDWAVLWAVHRKLPTSTWGRDDVS